jgi:hypothetical protein
MHTLRSDRGSHFLNDLCAEFYELVDIKHEFTLAERPQANGIAERSGGEVMRHLRAIVFDKHLQNIWSVVLPLTARIINSTFKIAIGTVPNRLMFLCPPDLDRGLFKFRPELDKEDVLMRPLASSSPFIVTIRDAYERMLDQTTAYVLSYQAELRKLYGVEEEFLTDFPVGTYVLFKVLVRPPTKLHYAWRGPFEVMKRVANTFTLRDLTNDATFDADISRLRQFFTVDLETPPLAIAAANLFGELEVEEISQHDGHPAERTKMKFKVFWSDTTETWEPWENVRKLAALDEYIAWNPDLKRLSSRNKK